MIVAGIGCGKGVSDAEVLAAVDAACQEYGLTAADIEALAVAEAKSEEPAIHSAAHRIGRVVIVIDGVQLASADDRTLSRSQRSRDATGASSASEAAAMAAVGASGRLLGPRVAVGRVTCALATDGTRP